MKRKKILGFISLIVITAVISSVIFSVSAHPSDPILNEEQKEELKELKEEFREETILPLLSDYGIIPEEGEGPCALKDDLTALTEEERIELFESLKNARQEFRENVIQPKLEEWEIDPPEFGERRNPEFGGRRGFMPLGRRPTCRFGTNQP